LNAEILDLIQRPLFWYCIGVPCFFILDRYTFFVRGADVEQRFIRSFLCVR